VGVSCAAFGGPEEFSDRRPAPPVSQQTLDFSVDVPITGASRTSIATLHT
jgi:hypothetical protein